MSEENARPSLSARLKGHIKEAPFFCKIIELVFCVISVGLIVDPFNNIPQEDLNHVAIVYVALCSYILINSIFIIAHLVGDKIPKITVLMFITMGVILCGAAGVVIIRDWKNFPNNMISRYLEQYSNQMIASGVFAILAAVVFVVDGRITNNYE